MSQRWLLTVNDLVRITRRSRSWVEGMRAAGIIHPRYVVGLLQFPWSTVNRLLSFEILQRVLGTNSEIPARIVKKFGAHIDQLPDGRWLDESLEIERMIRDELFALVPLEFWETYRERSLQAARDAQKIPGNE